MPATTRFLIPRWIQLVVLALGLLALWAVGGLLQGTLLVFVVSSLIALLLNPIVHALTVLRLPRGLSVLIVFLSAVVVVFGGLAIGGLAAVDQISSAGQVVDQQFRNTPGTSHSPADAKIDDLQRWLDRNGLRSIHVRKAGQEANRRIQQQGVSKYAGKAIDIGQTVATAVVDGVFHLILILVVSIYMLLDAPRLARFVNRLFPPAEDGRELGREVQRALGAYVRGQLLVSLIIGFSAGLAMESYGLLGIWPAARGYAVFFGLFAVLTEAIPYVGPVLGAVPPVVLALLDSPVTALWVLLAYLAIHQLEGHVVVPRVMGSALRAHPLAVIFCLIAGAEIWGIFGALLALPILSVARAVHEFFRDRIDFEPWPVRGLAGAGLGLATVEGGGPQPPLPGSPPPPAASPSDAITSVPRPPLELDERERQTTAGAAAPPEEGTR